MRTFFLLALFFFVVAVVGNPRRHCPAPDTPPKFGVTAVCGRCEDGSCPRKGSKCRNGKYAGGSTAPSEACGGACVANGKCAEPEKRGSGSAFDCGEETCIHPEDGWAHVDGWKWFDDIIRGEL
jgi:hypothetical protein